METIHITHFSKQYNNIAGDTEYEVGTSKHLEGMVESSIACVQDIAETCNRKNMDDIIEIHKKLVDIYHILEKYDVCVEE